MGSGNQKFGHRTTRVEPPTIEEAIAAAQGLTTDLLDQVQIAAALTGVPEADIRPLIARTRRQPTREVVGRSGARATVVVERKSRRVLTPGEMPTR